MDILDMLGIQAQYENWDKKDLLPLYLSSSYKFQLAILNNCRCIIITPKDELDILPALKKQIQKIQEIDNVQVILKIPSISSYRRKNMIENGIPFITNRQVYLPFMGTFLVKEDSSTKMVTKFMFSTQQLILLYFYSNEEKLYLSKAAKALSLSAMTLSRVARQLEMIDLFDISKDGVSKVIESKYEKQELFKRIRKYLSTPVRRVGYLEKINLTEDMVISGESALAEKTMLNQGRLKSYAIDAKKIDKTLVMDELVDPNKQVRIELWNYNPRKFTTNNVADDLSVILSLDESEDERVEEAIEELLEKTWEGI